MSAYLLTEVLERTSPRVREVPISEAMEWTAEPGQAAVGCVTPIHSIEYSQQGCMRKARECPGLWSLHLSAFAGGSLDGRVTGNRTRANRNFTLAPLLGVECSGSRSVSACAGHSPNSPSIARFAFRLVHRFAIIAALLVMRRALKWRYPV
jgi:hypothetical protein